MNSHADGRRLLLGAFGDPGHAFPMLALGERLAARGHDVTLQTWARWRRHVERAGLRFAAAPEYHVFPTRERPLRPYEAVVRAARDHGLLVVADGKRGDVPHTARAYAQALVGSTPGPFGPVRGLEADAFTANPLLGRDGLEPLVAAAIEAGAGCLVLVRTSNPGAAEVQDAPAPDRPLHERLARLVGELGAGALGASGLSSVGAVVGATRPDLLARMRELMPRAVLLLPGVGAQGGVVDRLSAVFAPHPAAALVTASRAIVDAHRAGGADPATAAASAAEELRAAAWSLGS